MPKLESRKVIERMRTNHHSLRWPNWLGLLPKVKLLNFSSSSNNSSIHRRSIKDRQLLVEVNNHQLNRVVLILKIVWGRKWVSRSKFANPTLLQWMWIKTATVGSCLINLSISQARSIQTWATPRRLPERLAIRARSSSSEELTRPRAFLKTTRVSRRVSGVRELQIWWKENQLFGTVLLHWPLYWIQKNWVK